MLYAETRNTSPISVQNKIFTLAGIIISISSTVCVRERVNLQNSAVIFVAEAELQALLGSTIQHCALPLSAIGWARFV